MKALAIILTVLTAFAFWMAIFFFARATKLGRKKFANNIMYHRAIGATCFWVLSGFFCGIPAGIFWALHLFL